MDVSSATIVAQTVVGLVVPYLASQAVGARIGGGTESPEGGFVNGGPSWQLAAAVWERVAKRSTEKPEMQRAITAVTENPADFACLAELRRQMRRLLLEDPLLLSEVSEALQAHGADGLIATSAKPERGAAIGGTASGSIVIRGDANGTNRL